MSQIATFRISHFKLVFEPQSTQLECDASHERARFDWHLPSAESCMGRVKITTLKA